MPKKKQNKEDEEAKAIVKEVVEEITPYTRSIQIATMHTQVLVSSDDPKDSLNTIKKMAIDLVDKYKQ